MAKLPTGTKHRKIIRHTETPPSYYDLAHEGEKLNIVIIITEHIINCGSVVLHRITVANKVNSAYYAYTRHYMGWVVDNSLIPVFERDLEGVKQMRYGMRLSSAMRYRMDDNGRFFDIVKWYNEAQVG